MSVVPGLTPAVMDQKSPTADASSVKESIHHTEAVSKTQGNKAEDVYNVDLYVSFGLSSTSHFDDRTAYLAPIFAAPAPLMSLAAMKRRLWSARSVE